MKCLLEARHNNTGVGLGRLFSLKFRTNTIHLEHTDLYIEDSVELGDAKYAQMNELNSFFMPFVALVDRVESRHDTDWIVFVWDPDLRLFKIPFDSKSRIYGAVLGEIF